MTISLFISAAYAQKTLQNGDIIKKNSLRLNIDGLEIWDVHPDLREETLKAFTKKCLQEIVQRSSEHEADLAAEYDFFNGEGYKRTHKVKKNRTRYGYQYICQADIQILDQAEFFFSPEYSKIYTDRRNGTYDLCAEKIKTIDETAIEDAVFTRRAYFDYAKASCTRCPIFPRCQTLKIIIKQKK